MVVFGLLVLTFSISETRRDDLGPMKVLWSEELSCGWGGRRERQREWLHQFSLRKSLKESLLMT